MSLAQDTGYPPCPTAKKKLHTFNKITVAAFIMIAILALFFTMWLLYNFRGVQYTAKRGTRTHHYYDKGFLALMFLFFAGVITTTGFATWFQNDREDKIERRKNMLHIPTSACVVVMILAFLYHYRVLGARRRINSPVKFILPISILAGSSLTLCVFALLQ